MEEQRLAMIWMEIQAIKAKAKASSQEYRDRIKELEEEADRLSRDLACGQMSIEGEGGPKIEVIGRRSPTRT